MWAQLNEHFSKCEHILSSSLNFPNRKNQIPLEERINRGLDSISYEVSDMVNGSYFYSKLNQNELKNIKSYFHRKEMLKVR